MQANVIYCGDCAKVMALNVPDDSIDLIYLDPPFFSNRNYEVLWGDGYELRAFEDRWKGGIENYIAWMEDKLRECHRVLKPTGSIYVHCDWHANAHLRILLDKIFGGNRFVNEIIWCYRTGGATKKRFSRKHDNIYFYSKTDDYKFNSIKERIYYDKPFFCDQQDEQGRYYADVLPVDWWEIPAVINVSKERLGYPTQKPELLLERIINASSDANDIILDPFCGCGTATAVAHKLGRRFIGIDVSPTACRLIQSRMHKLGITPEIIGMPKSIDELRALAPFEFQNHVVRLLGARVSAKMVGDLGADGHMFDGSPIQIKQSEHVDRVTVDKMEATMLREKKTHGVIVGFSFTKGAFEEVARAKNEHGFVIELRTVEDLLDEG